MLSVSAAGFVTVSGDLDFVATPNNVLVAEDPLDLDTFINVGPATVLSVSSSTGMDLSGAAVQGLVGAEVLDNPIGATGDMAVRGGRHAETEGVEARCRCVDRYIEADVKVPP